MMTTARNALAVFFCMQKGFHQLVPVNLRKMPEDIVNQFTAGGRQSLVAGAKELQKIQDFTLDPLEACFPEIKRLHIDF